MEVNWQAYTGVVMAVIIIGIICPDPWALVALICLFLILLAQIFQLIKVVGE